MEPTHQSLNTLESLFGDALDVPREQRESWLEEHCANSERLLESLRALLAAHDANSDNRITPLPVKAPSEEIPISIGAYAVTRLVAEGSIGSVFDGRHSVTNRRAAIKLLRAGFATTRQKMRFQLEAEMLGKLNHPGIAQLYEAGIADVTYHGAASRRAFIAMEYVEGEAISTYVEANKTSLRDRVKLIRDAAFAVEHAHHRGILHRDLKPANLLVTSEGQVKVVDFGIAKLIEGEAGLTHEGVIAGTPSFMSPEQLMGKPEEIDLPADVYGLGATLYLLLTGNAPVSTTGLLSPAGVVRLLSAQIPNARSKCPEIDADLAAVIHKSLEKRASDRYADASALAADLNRWLDGLPTKARPLSWVGRSAKYIRRHKYRSAAAGITLLAVLSALIALVLAARAVRQERAALEEQQAATSFMNEMLVRLNPDDAHTLGPDQKLSDLIDQAEVQLASLDARPHVQASVRVTLAKAQLALGRLDAAEKDANAAIAAFDAFGDDSANKIAAKEVLAQCALERGRVFEMGDLRYEIYEWRLKHQGAEHPGTLRAAAELMLGETLSGFRHSAQLKLKALPDLVQQMEEQKKAIGDKWTPEFAADMIRCRELASYLHIELMDKPADVVGQVDKAIAESTALNGKNHLITIRLERIKAVGLLRQGDFAQAETLLRSVHDRLAARVAEKNPTVLLLEQFLGDAEHGQGNLDAAMAIYQRVAPQLLEVLGPKHYRVVMAKLAIASILREKGQLDEADRLTDECLAQAKQTDGDNRYVVRLCYLEQVRILRVRGEIEKAIKLFWDQVSDRLEYPSISSYVQGEVGLWYLDYIEMLEQTGQHERAEAFAKVVAYSMHLAYGSEAHYTKLADSALERLQQAREPR